VADSFAHLHVHTEYSMLDGAARIDAVVAKAAADGQPGIGITDHGNMYGVIDFYKAARGVGIKPIIGTEAYMAHESRHERPTRRGGRIDDSGGDAEGGQKLYYHLTLLAESDAGYRNLVQLASRAYLEGYYYKPRIDWEVLADHSEGLIATTGCLGGHVLQSLLRGDVEGATERAARLQDIFGRDNLFVELQDHGIPEQKRTNPQLLELARRIGAPLVVTNDSHYVHREDAEAHDALLCVQTGALMSDADRFRFHGAEHYLKSAEEMRYLFREVEVACDNTLWIAERCNVELEFGTSKLPEFPVPEGFADDAAYLEHLAFEGARRRWGDQLPDDVVERIAFELQVISAMGFSSYFLIVWDLIRHARDSGIRVGPGRGSAAGCAVAYALWITDLDPIRYDLLFERFLNPSRISMPDIDMDFDSRYREEMIRYAAERYGRDHVAQIITFSQIKARAAVRDAARVLGLPYAKGDQVAKAMPPLVMGRDTPLYACLDEHEKFADGYRMAADLRALYQGDDEVRRIVDVARGLEGLRRQDSVHAAAVVIAPKPLTEYLPIQRKPESSQAPEDAPIITQYEMHGVEELGLLKMDFLGLRNLDVITDTLQMIERLNGVRVDIDHVDLEDRRTYELLGRGDTIGVFQLESTPMRELIRSMQPERFDDVAALVALYRPGPMAANMHNDYADRKNGRKSITYLHPDAEEILADTYGLMIYQEAMMRIAQRFAGYSLAEADNLRKACGKKDRALLAKEREKFIEGSERVGYGRELGEAWFEIIEPFADYAFNKSHSYGYGFVAYQTAYLKANYPVEYLSCLLTSVKGNLDKAAVYLNECRTMGIRVLVPDINRAVADFSPDGEGGIVFGLSAVRNVGEGLVELIVAEREANGPFVDFHDFCRRVDLKVLNRRTVESLVKAGAFDALGHPRQGLLAVHERIIDDAVARRREFEMGVQTLFGSFDDGGEPTFDERTPIPDHDFDRRTRLAFEKEMLGLYVSDHPLRGFERRLASRTDCSLEALAERPASDSSIVAVGGVVTSVERKFTRRGDQMGILSLEDATGTVECVVFARQMELLGHLLTAELSDQVVVVKGRVDTREDSPKIVVNGLEVLDVEEEGAVLPLRLRLAPHRLDDRALDRLRDMIDGHPGDSPVLLEVGGRTLRLPEVCRVDTTNGLVGELRELFGADCVRL